MEFAIGSAAKVLGPEFAEVDAYPARVRLPDEPLMLVDRILSVEGRKGGLGSGRIVTEHDVCDAAWYLDGGRAPVCISVEAGQADLFLCAYLGIDLAVKGKRTYRLLDATVSFHRGLPRPGDTIRYEIEIEKFVRQGDTYLFFFSFEGYIGATHLITMTGGCAGFFTEQEVVRSGGIIPTPRDRQPLEGRRVADWRDLAAVPEIESYSDAGLEALREGRLDDCFGADFEGMALAPSLRLPGGRMHLIDRILSLDPRGGRYGLGLIRAEADIHPDDWFLTCHFVDDRVMPGTLMYECCGHTLRVFLQRIGWISANPDACYEPQSGLQSVLKCRGPVTPATRHVIYEVEISEIGYGPEPYAVADAHMFADGHRIVRFRDMGMKMSGVSRREIESLWDARAHKGSGTVGRSGPPAADRPQAIFDRRHILAFAEGKPSEAFGAAYEIFDRERFIARLPRPPYSFIHRITHIEPPARVLKPGGWVEAEYDLDPNDWYFRANRQPSMPFCILLEAALQICGWLAAYLGSALKSPKDLKFRNLEGTCVLHHNVPRQADTLRMRCRLTHVSTAVEMIIEQFDLRVLQQQRLIYEGSTTFGFFTREALSQQVGLRNTPKLAAPSASEQRHPPIEHDFADHAPMTPDDPHTDPAPGLAMPAGALRMIDRIECYLRDGGPHGLGYIRAVKAVRPQEWFFNAHFFQDPVCPGSLGIESFLQLIKFAALDRWKDLAGSHRFETMTEISHGWTYRGQIIPENRLIEVEAVVTRIEDGPRPFMLAHGLLTVDGLAIYEMTDFGIRLTEKDQNII